MQRLTSSHPCSCAWDAFVCLGDFHPLPDAHIEPIHRVLSVCCPSSLLYYQEVHGSSLQWDCVFMSLFVLLGLDKLPGCLKIPFWEGLKCTMLGVGLQGAPSRCEQLHGPSTCITHLDHHKILGTRILHQLCRYTQGVLRCQSSDTSCWSDLIVTHCPVFAFALLLHLG